MISVDIPETETMHKLNLGAMMVSTWSDHNAQEELRLTSTCMGSVLMLDLPDSKETLEFLKQAVILMEERHE